MPINIQKIDYLTELVVQPVHRDYPAKHLAKNTDKFILWQDFVVRVTVDGAELVITVPKGFASDGASIPRVFHRLYHPFTTEARWASAVHDYIYAVLFYKYSKEFADVLLREMIKKDGGGWFMCDAFYRAVRLNVCGGGWHS